MGMGMGMGVGKRRGELSFFGLFVGLLLVLLAGNIL